MLKQSLFLKYIKKLRIWWLGLSTEGFVFVINTIFYFGLLFLNPGNKLIAVTFVLLYFIYDTRFKNTRLSLIFCYFSSLIITAGKTYSIELIPKSMFVTEFWNQEGYSIAVIVNPTLIIGILMVSIIFKDFLIKRKLKSANFQKIDIFLFLYFLTIQFSDMAFSKMPEISSLISFSGLTVMFAFIFIKLYKPNLKIFIPLIVSLICSQVLFESFLTFNQFLSSSPLGKNVEFYTVYSGFGGAADELALRFRPMGTMIHANNLAGWMTFMLLIIFVYNYKKANIYYFLINVLGISILILTLSRGAWITYFLGTIFCLYLFEKVKKIEPPYFLKQSKRGFLLLSVVFIIFFIFPRFQKSLNLLSGGAEFRGDQLKASSSVLKNNWIFGVGSSMALVSFISDSPAGYFRNSPMPIHNWYITTLIEHGVLSLVFLMFFIILTLRSEINKLYINKVFNELDHFRLGYIISTTSLLIIGIFQPFLFENMLILASAIIVQGLQKSNKGEL